jgi:hypothetical protein
MTKEKKKAEEKKAEKKRALAREFWANWAAQRKNIIW